MSVTVLMDKDDEREYLGTQERAEQLRELTERLIFASTRSFEEAVRVLQAELLRQRLEQHKLDCRFPADQCRTHADLERQLWESEGKCGTS